MSTLTHDECDGTCNPDEPSCVEGLDHHWTAKGEGGCSENPGVWATGGTTLVCTEHCIYCGVRRVEKLVGSQRNPGQCDTVSYEVGERDEVAIAAALRIEHRRYLARLRFARRVVDRRRAEIDAALADLEKRWSIDACVGRLTARLHRRQPHLAHHDATPASVG